MYKLYKEIQYSSVSSRVEVLLTSKNFSDFVTKLYGMTAIQDEAERVQTELKDNLDFLSEQKAAQLNLLNKQNQSKGLLNSKQSSLTQLYISTDDKQKKYDEEVKAKNEAAKKVQEELTKLPPAVISYIYSNGGNPAVKGDSNGPCYFYETRALEYPEGYFMTPTEGAYTNNFNCYPWSWSWQKNGHDGVDIANGTGTPILATADGVIYKKGFDFGNDVSIQHKLPSGQTVYSLYGHLSQPSPLAVGTKVKKGQFIASMGSTGFSTGPHLHFMIISDTYEQYGPWCSYGNRQAKCYNPAKILGW
jgi:murein DD-endopeptidase MepM/ murein hydrolase activator NlpD